VSNISDDEIQDMKKSMNAEMTRRIAKSRKMMMRYNKGQDKPIPLRHHYNANDDHILV